MLIENEKVFSVPAPAFGVSGSASGFTLNYSVDGNNWTAAEEATPANETLFVTGCPKFMKYKLVGNSGQVEVRW